MAKVLLTGASGFLGSALAESLRGRGHFVVAVSRSSVSTADRYIEGVFSESAVLGLAEADGIDTVVHLAAEVGGCTEEAGIAVNVEGTRRLLRFWIDRGVRRFILASSIAAAVGLDRDVVPQHLPVSDAAESIATDAYGLSKALMEYVAEYFGRQNPHIDITMFRLGVVLKPDALPASNDTVTNALFPFVSLTVISREDALEAFVRAVEKTWAPGVRRFNVASPTIRSPLPVLQTMALLFPEGVPPVDLSHYLDPARLSDSFFDTRAAQEYLGFTPRIDPRTLQPVKDDTP